MVVSGVSLDVGPPIPIGFEMLIHTGLSNITDQGLHRKLWGVFVLRKETPGLIQDPLGEIVGRQQHLFKYPLSTVTLKDLYKKSC